MRAFCVMIVALLLAPACTVIATAGEVGASVWRTIEERTIVHTNIPYRSHVVQIHNMSDYPVYVAKDVNVAPVSTVSLKTSCPDGDVIPPHTLGGLALSNFGRSGYAEYAISVVAFNEDGSVIGTWGSRVWVDGRRKEASIWKIYNCSFGQSCGVQKCRHY